MSTIDNTEVRTAVKSYIVALNGRGDDVGDDDNIIDKGLIASIQLLDLINFIADTYSVDINEAHVFDGHFASVDSIVEFIATEAVAA